MGNLRDFMSGAGRSKDRRSTEASEPVPVDRREGDRRQVDRRGSIDLNRPSYLERRKVQDARRGADIDRAEETAEVLSTMESGTAVSAPVPVTEPESRTAAELEADFAALQEAMDKRLHLLKDLPEEEFEAAQARAEDLVTAWAVTRQRLQAEIVAAREREAQS
jgi:hypothetical protein